MSRDLICSHLWFDREDSLIRMWMLHCRGIQKQTKKKKNTNFRKIQTVHRISLDKPHSPPEKTVPNKERRRSWNRSSQQTGLCRYRQIPFRYLLLPLAFSPINRNDWAFLSISYERLAFSSHSLLYFFSIDWRRVLHLLDWKKASVFKSLLLALFHWPLFFR